jgi:hypothetical protein
MEDGIGKKVGCNSQYRDTARHSGPPDGETPTTIVRAFYWTLARATGTRRVALRYPHGQRLQVAGLDLIVQVMAYSGRLTRNGNPIPRITVRQPTLDRRGRWTPRIYGPALLELTLTLDRLVTWAPWVAAWVRGRAAGDTNAILAPPDTLTASRSAAGFLRGGYYWTRLASNEYARREPTWAKVSTAPCETWSI